MKISLIWLGLIIYKIWGGGERSVRELGRELLQKRERLVQEKIGFNLKSKLLCTSSIGLVNQEFDRNIGRCC